MADSGFAEQFHNFARDLYQEAIEGNDRNVVFSPISIQTALSFVMFGASGETLNEMKTALMFTEISEAKLLESFQKLTENFETGGLSVANKIYLMKNYSVNQKFQKIATKSFQSEAETVDFAKNVETAENINQWVESKTNNKIKDLIKADSLDSNTGLVLVNAIYFKAEFVHPFHSRNNFQDKFYVTLNDTVEVEYMRQTKFFKFVDLDDLKATALGIAYKNSNVVLMIILPNFIDGLPELQSKISSIDFIDIQNKMYSNNVCVTIPKFKIEFDIDLVEPLKKMGMGKMFSDSAEFGNLLNSPEPLKVSQVVHKAFIEVNEKGTEAGAATSSGITFQSMPRDFTCNKPFLFALMENSKILFIGRKIR